MRRWETRRFEKVGNEYLVVHLPDGTWVKGGAVHAVKLGGDLIHDFVGIVRACRDTCQMFDYCGVDGKKCDYAGGQ